jgi:hypothetical protein
LFTALNLLPSIATLAFVSKPISRQSSTKQAHTLRMAGPLSFRKSATVLWSGTKAAEKPHQLDIATGLAFESPARLDPIEVSIDVQLQESRGVIGGPPSLRRRDLEPEIGKIERVDERIDHPNGIFRVVPIAQASRDGLAPINPSTKRLI